jgi:hypothetical protein
MDPPVSPTVVTKLTYEEQGHETFIKKEASEQQHQALEDEYWSLHTEWMELQRNVHRLDDYINSIQRGKKAQSETNPSWNKKTLDMLHRLWADFMLEDAVLEKKIKIARKEANNAGADVDRLHSAHKMFQRLVSEEARFRDQDGFTSGEWTNSAN